MAQQTEISCAPFGCFGLIASIIFFWALIFGVTVDGKHYAIDCSCSKGVEVQK